MQMAGHPARHRVVAETMRGWRNPAPAPKQADALNRAREVLRLPRRGCEGRLESAETAHKRAALDLAIIGVLADGTGRPTLQKGNNQVEPQTVAVNVATARTLGEVRPADADLKAPVFGLTGEP